MRLIEDETGLPPDTLDRFLESESGPVGRGKKRAREDSPLDPGAGPSSVPGQDVSVGNQSPPAKELVVAATGDPQEPSPVSTAGESSQRDKGKRAAGEAVIYEPPRNDEGIAAPMAEFVNLGLDLEAHPPRMGSLRGDILKHHLAVVAHVNRGLALAEEEDWKAKDAASRFREERDRLQVEVVSLRERAAVSDSSSAEVESLRKKLKAARRRSRKRREVAEEERERAADEKERADRLEARTATAEKSALDAQLALFLAKNTIGDLEAEVGQLRSVLEEQRRGEERRVIEASENAVDAYKRGPSYSRDAGVAFRPQLLALLKALVEELGQRDPGFDPRTLDVLKVYFDSVDKGAVGRRPLEEASPLEGNRSSRAAGSGGELVGPEGPRDADSGPAPHL